MSEHATLAPEGELILDPFSYHPENASAIQGLGGSRPHEDLSYALHTDYVKVAEGPAHFIVRFQGLTAKQGTLQLRVHMFIEEPHPRFLLANTLRIQFNRLVQLGGEVAIRFEGFRNVGFALHGAVLGASDARATGLSVALDRPAGADEGDGEGSYQLHNTSYGQNTTRAAPHLVITSVPTLSHPVSQVATLPQTREPHFAEWCGRLGLGREPDLPTWGLAYVLQVIRTYGMLEADAAGLGFGAQAAAIEAVLRDAGLRTTVADLPDWPSALPGPLVNFDVVWSVDAIARWDPNEMLETADGLMRCLRPGGLAVHVLRFLPGMDQRTPEERSGGEVILLRGDVERLALSMIARGFEAAQVTVNQAQALYDAAEVSAFGLVFRKPPLAH